MCRITKTKYKIGEWIRVETNIILTLERHIFIFTKMIQVDVVAWVPLNVVKWCLITYVLYEKMFMSKKNGF